MSCMHETPTYIIHFQMLNLTYFFFSETLEWPTFLLFRFRTNYALLEATKTKNYKNTKCKEMEFHKQYNTILKNRQQQVTLIS